jgi:hypothetical protein
MWITETIIPWTSEWVFHHKLWRVGGEVPQRRTRTQVDL